jgi:RNA polymerase sigma-70 factor, ECF subfamily
VTITSLELQSTAAETDDLEHATAVFLTVRPRLFKVAYRVLGNVCEAEDLMQEVWLRWQRTDRTEVLNPPAFLATMTARLAINVAKSARWRHEISAGPWLPDRAGSCVDPQTEAERGEEVEQAVHLLLERLSPAERAAYVLREGFEYPYREIAETLQLGAANTRQLVTRARQRLFADRRQPVTTTTHRRLLHALAAAARAGELAELEELLTSELAS